jgi:hypothetical protein
MSSEVGVAITGVWFDFGSWDMLMVQNCFECSPAIAQTLWVAVLN